MPFPGHVGHGVLLVEVFLHCGNFLNFTTRQKEQWQDAMNFLKAYLCTILGPGSYSLLYYFPKLTKKSICL